MFAALRNGPFVRRGCRANASTQKALRPVLRAMENARDFDGVFRHLIDDDVRQRWEQQLPPAANAAAGSPKVGMLSQPGASVKYGSGNAAGRFRVITLDAVTNALQVLGGWQRPADFHQGLR